MVLVKMNIELMRQLSQSLSQKIEGLNTSANELQSEASKLELSSSNLNIYGHLSDARQKQKVLDMKIDLIQTINSGDDPNATSIGTVTCDIGEDSLDNGTVERQLGDAMAELSKKVAYGHPSDKQIEVLANNLEKYQKNGTFSTAYADNLGPSGILDVVEFLGDDYAYKRGKSGGEIDEKALKGLKSTVTTATNYWNPEKSRKFGEDLVDQACKPSEKLHIGLPSRTQALAWLIHDNDLAGSDFFSGVLEKVDYHQRFGPERHSNGWSWSGTNYFAELVDSRDENTIFYTNIPEIVFSAVSKKNDPKVPFNFFTDKNGNPVEDRLNYWTKNYRPTTIYKPITEMLDLASTGDRQKHPESSAKIASWAINGLTSNEDYRKNYSGTEKNILHIIDTYMDGAEDSIRHPHGSETKDGEATKVGLLEKNDQPVFRQGSLEAAISVIAQDDVALVGMTQMLRKHRRDTLLKLEDPGDIKSAVQDHARTEGFFAHAVGTDGIAHAKNKDDRIRATVDLLMAPAKAYGLGALGDAYKSFNKHGDWIANKAIDEATDHFNANFANNEEREISKQVNQAIQGQNDYRVGTMLTIAEKGFAGFQAEKNIDQLVASRPRIFRKNADGSQRLITESEYNALPDDERKEAAEDIVQLADDRLGLGGYLTSQDMLEAYQSGFHEYYPPKK